MSTDLPRSQPRPGRSLRSDDGALSEVLGKVLMIAITVSLLGGFGALVLSTVSEDTPAPPSASFTMEPQRGAAYIHVRLVSGASIQLAASTVSLSVEGNVLSGTPTVIDPLRAGYWSTGEVLNLSLGSGQLAGGEDVMFLVADIASGTAIGTAYATVPSATTGATVHFNQLSLNLDFSPVPLVADGVSTVNASLFVNASHGLLLIDYVELNLTPVGGPGALRLYDDGLHGDGSAGDGQFATSFSVSNHTFTSLPGVDHEPLWAAVVDVLGNVTYATDSLHIVSQTPSKVGAGVLYRDIGPSGVIQETGYINLSSFVLRDALELDNDQIELRVSDLTNTSRVWTALVSFNDTGSCSGVNGITSIELRNASLTGASVVYTPSDGCFAIDEDAKINLAYIYNSLNANGLSETWTATATGGTEAQFLYANAQIGSLNEALISFFGDNKTISPSARGITQTDFSWAPPGSGATTAPDAITTLAGTAGNGYVDLTWTAPSNGGSAITGYTIYVDGVAIATIGTNTTFRVNSLTNGQSYTFTVTATNANGESAASNSVARTPLAAPSAPTNFGATRGNESVTLAWTAPLSNGGSAITGYHVYVGTASGSTTYSATVGALATGYTVTGLTNGVQYYFNVTAVNAAGNGTSTSYTSTTPSTTPYPPGALVATAGDGQVLLTWTAGNTGGSPLLNYRIYRGTTSGATTLLAATGSGGNTTFLDDEAVNGVTYYYNVTAINVNGVSASSNEDTATPAAGATVPSAPQTLSATRGNGTVSLSWSPPDSSGGQPVTNYCVYVGTTSGSETFLGCTGGTNTTFVASGLTNGQTYFFNVTAVNAIGSSSGSNEANATPASVAYPPSGLTPTAGNGTVSLSWSAPANTGGLAITNYCIYSGTSSGSTSLLGCTGGTNTTFAANGLTNGQTYYFEVKAVNAIGSSAGSNEVSAVPVTVPNPPVIAVTRGDGSTTLTWSAPANGGSALTNYKVYVGTSTTTSFLAFTGSGANTSFTVNGLTNGQAYFFNVTAVNAVGESSTSNMVSTTPAAVPSAPLSPTATKGNGSVTLSWSAPSSSGGSGITNYCVYSSTTPGGETLLGCTGGTNTTFVANGLTNGQTYYFTIAAQNSVGTGAQSGEVSATPSSVAYPPSGLSATAGNATASLSWTAPASNGGSAITSYCIYRGSSSGGETFLGCTGSTSAQYNDTGLTNGQVYYYNVTALNANGQSAGSNEVSVTPVTVPLPPTSLVATKGNTTVSLSWAAPSSNGGTTLTNYCIYSGTSSGTETFLACTGGTNTSFVVNGLTNGQIYYYNVTAVNAVGSSAGSNEASATPSTVPYPPTSLSATRGNQSATLSWSAPAVSGGSAITNYCVYRGTSSGSTTFLGCTGGTNTSFVVNGLTNGQPYFFNVTAVNANGQSVGSNEAAATPATVPNPPATFTATAGTNQVGLSWTAGDAGGSSITAYQIWRGSTSGGETLLATTGTNTTWTDANVVAGSTYYYYVKAVNSVGASGQSVERSATPTSAGSVAGAPILTNVTPANARNHLTWTAPTFTGGTSLTGYNVYRSTTNSTGSMTLLATIGTNTTFLDATASNNVTYYYLVRALNANGVGNLSNIKDGTPRTINTLDCSTMVSTSGSVDCSAIQLDDGVVGTLRESSGGSKVLEIRFNVNMTGVTGTQTVTVQGNPQNSAENLLVQAWNPATSTWTTIVTLLSTVTADTTATGSIASTYWPSGTLQLRFLDGEVNNDQSSWLIDYLAVSTT